MGMEPFQEFFIPWWVELRLSHQAWRIRMSLCTREQMIRISKKNGMMIPWATSRKVVPKSPNSGFTASITFSLTICQRTKSGTHSLLVRLLMASNLQLKVSSKIAAMTWPITFWKDWDLNLWRRRHLITPHWVIYVHSTKIGSQMATLKPRWLKWATFIFHMHAIKIMFIARR